MFAVFVGDHIRLRCICVHFAVFAICCRVRTSVFAHYLFKMFTVYVARVCRTFVASFAFAFADVARTAHVCCYVEARMFTLTICAICAFYVAIISAFVALR